MTGMIPWKSPNPLVEWPYPLWVRAGTSDGDSLQSQIHEDEYGLRDYLKTGDVVVDIGAYIGAVSTLALSLGAEVCAVEPLASNVEMWERNTSPWRNYQVRSTGGHLRSDHDRARLWHGAVSATEAKVPILQRSQSDEYGRQNRHVMYTAAPFDAETAVVEYADPIDINLILRAATHGGANRVACLKIDIEGAEWAILPTIRHDLLALVDRVAMEVHAPRAGMTTEECFALAESMLPGFKRERTKHNDIFLRRAT